MRPSWVGEQVFVVLDPETNNWGDIAPAWVVRADNAPLTDNQGRACQTVNVRVLADGPDAPWLTSVSLYEDRPDGRPRPVAFRNVPVV